MKRLNILIIAIVVFITSLIVINCSTYETISRENIYSEDIIHYNPVFHFCRVKGKGELIATGNNYKLIAIDKNDVPIIKIEVVTEVNIFGFISKYVEVL